VAFLCQELDTMIWCRLHSAARVARWSIFISKPPISKALEWDVLTAFMTFSYTLWSFA
jgi:hypothetical protein